MCAQVPVNETALSHVWCIQPMPRRVPGACLIIDCIHSLTQQRQHTTVIAYNQSAFGFPSSCNSSAKCISHSQTHSITARTLFIVYTFYSYFYFYSKLSLFVNDLRLSVQFLVRSVFQYFCKGKVRQLVTWFLIIQHPIRFVK